MPNYTAEDKRLLIEAEFRAGFASDIQSGDLIALINKSCPEHNPDNVRIETFNVERAKTGPFYVGSTKSEDRVYVIAVDLNGEIRFLTFTQTYFVFIKRES